MKPAAVPIASEPGRERPEGHPGPAPAAGARRRAGKGEPQRAIARKVHEQQTLSCGGGRLSAFPETLAWGNFLIVNLDKNNILAPPPYHPPQERYVPNQPRRANPAAVSAAPRGSGNARNARGGPAAGPSSSARPSAAHAPLVPIGFR